jgi:hypothetical protein
MTLYFHRLSGKPVCIVSHLDRDTEWEGHGDDDEEEGEHGQQHRAHAGTLGIGWKKETGINFRRSFNLLPRELVDWKVNFFQIGNTYPSFFWLLFAPDPAPSFSLPSSPLFNKSS